MNTFKSFFILTFVFSHSILRSMEKHPDADQCDSLIEVENVKNNDSNFALIASIFDMLKVYTDPEQEQELVNKLTVQEQALVEELSNKLMNLKDSGSIVYNNIPTEKLISVSKLLNDLRNNHNGSSIDVLKRAIDNLNIDEKSKFEQFCNKHKCCNKLLISSSTLLILLLIVTYILYCVIDGDDESRGFCRAFYSDDNHTCYSKAC